MIVKGMNCLKSPNWTPWENLNHDYIVLDSVPRSFRAAIEPTFILYSTIFHSIPRYSKALAGTD